MKAEDQLAEREALPPLPGALVIAALRAMDAEARKRGEMFPQTNEEQSEDIKAVRTVIESLEFYTCPRQCDANGWPMVKGWPALPDGDGVDARAGPLSADEASAMFSRSIGARPIDGRRLYSFLEPGDVIQLGDEFYNDGTWAKAGGYLVGNPYESFHFLARRPAAGVPPVAAPKLQVWFGSMPESNGKANWTAILHRGDMEEGFTIARSEHKDRVRYDADRVRFLLGELDKEPFILDYDGNLIEHADDARYAEWEKADAVARGVRRVDGGQR